MLDEAQWLQGTYFQALHAYLCDDLKVPRTKVGRRRLRLFAVACCRWVWHLLPDAPCRSAVEVAERFAEGQATRQELDAAFAATVPCVRGHPYGKARYHAASAALDAVRPEVSWASFAACKASFGVNGDMSNDHGQVCDLLRDVFGNPFRPVTVERSWLKWNDGTVPKMAQAIYDERAFDRLPVLADALEDAGCAEAQLLDHCRGAGPHVRGCWVIDLLKAA
jgi:hypothetical protein